MHTHLGCSLQPKQSLFQLLLLKSSSRILLSLGSHLEPEVPLSSAACLTALGGSWYLNQEETSASVREAFNLYNDSTQTLIIQANNSCYNSGSKGPFWSLSSQCFHQTKVREDRGSYPRWTCHESEDCLSGEVKTTLRILDHRNGTVPQVLQFNQASLNTK